MINFFSILTLAYFSLEKIYDILYKATSEILYTNVRCVYTVIEIS